MRFKLEPGPERQSALRTIAGFACNQGFVFSLFYMGANRALGTGSLAFERADLFGTLLFVVLGFALLRVASPKARSALLSPALVWCYAALMLVGSLAVVALGPHGTAGLVVECALIGVPSALMLAAWGRALGVQPVDRCVVEAFAASAIGAVVCFALAAVSIPEVLLVLKLLPIGSAAALRGLLPVGLDAGPNRRLGAADAAKDDEEGDEPARVLSFGSLFATSEQRSQAVRLSRKVVAGTVLFGLAAGFMETYGSDPGMASTPTFPASLLLFVLFCIAALQLLATGGLGDGVAAGGQGPKGAGVAGAGGDTKTLKGVQGGSVLAAGPEAEGPLDSVYRLAMLVMTAGFLFVPVLSDFGVPGEAIVLAGYLGLTYVLVSLFLVITRLTGQDAALSFARGFSALYLGEMAGIGLGNVIDFVGQAGQTPYVVVACAGLATLFAYLFLFTERDFRALSVIARDADRFEDVCGFIAAEYGLSKREAEVLPLALKGRTGERMAAELFISKSTVDTHLRRIYAKCDVHSRQELIDLGERTTRTLVGR